MPEISSITLMIKNINAKFFVQFNKMINRPNNSRRIFARFVWHFLLTTFIFSNFAFAQTISAPAEPRREQLLNGLKIMFFNEPNGESVTVKLRLNSGSAFDPQGKEGLMKLSANLLFDDGIRTLFTEDYGGSLVVTSNYDYVQINATGKSEHLLSMLDVLQNAVLNFAPTADRLAEERKKLLETIAERQKNPSIVADEAVAKRLFGNFPYGRSEFGTPESLAKIDRFDLVGVREKFFTSDNSILAISGNIQTAQTLRALKQFFGSWQKADKLVPPTFRQPDAPNQEMLKIEMPNVEKTYFRNAGKTFGRSNKDFFGTKVLTEIWKTQYCLNDESKRGELRYEPYLLRGAFTIRNIESEIAKNGELPIDSRNVCAFFLLNGKRFPQSITQNDLDSAKSKVVAEYQQKLQSTSSLADWWLDVETYKLTSVKDELSRLNSVTLADVQRVAETLQKEPMASVSVIKKVSEQKP